MKVTPTMIEELADNWIQKVKVAAAAKLTVESLAFQYHDQEMLCILGGKISGSNAKEREASLYFELGDLPKNLFNAKQSLIVANAEVEVAKREYRALQFQWAIQSGKDSEYYDG